MREFQTQSSRHKSNIEPSAIGLKKHRPQPFSQSCEVHLKFSEIWPVLRGCKPEGKNRPKENVFVFRYVIHAAMLPRKLVSRLLATWPV